MATQFKRYVSLIIGAESGALDFSESKIVFNVEKSIVGYPNLAKIDIYNLSEESIANITSVYNTLVLDVGYGDRHGIIFTGEIRNVHTMKIGVDRITTVYAGDAQKAIDESFYAKNFKKGAGVVEMFKDMAKSLQFTDKSISIGQIVASGTKLADTMFNGATKDCLDSLCEDTNTNWSIQDAEFVVIGRDQAIEDQYIPIVEINQNTGMVGLPTLTEIGSDVSSLLNPDIRPNGLIRISSQTFDNNLTNLKFRDTRNRDLGNGIFRVNKVIHSGDTRGNNWYSVVTGQSKGITINE